MYRNNPAVRERIHPLASVLFVLIATPIKKPTIDVSEERKFIIRAVNQCIPALIRIT